MNPQDQIQQELLKELGLENFSPAQQQETMATIGGPVLQSVLLDIAEQIPEPQRTEFQAALEVGYAPRIKEIIEANIPDSNAFIATSAAKALAEFKAN